MVGASTRFEAQGLGGFLGHARSWDNARSWDIPFTMFGTSPLLEHALSNAWDKPALETCPLKCLGHARSWGRPFKMLGPSPLLGHALLMFGTRPLLGHAL